MPDRGDQRVPFESKHTGCEKLCVCKAENAWLTAPTHNVLASELVSAAEHSGFAAPESFFMVKGWSRSVVCLSVLLACYDRRDMLEARTETSRVHVLVFKVLQRTSTSTIYTF